MSGIELERINLNTWPIWLIAVAVTLYFLPRILQGLSIFIPPLQRYFENRAELVGVQLHAQLDSNAVNLQQSIKSQDKMLAILQEALNRAWNDREATQRWRAQMVEGMGELRHSTIRSSDIVRTSTTSLTQLSDEMSRLTNQIERQTQHMAAIVEWVIDRNHTDGAS